MQLRYLDAAFALERLWKVTAPAIGLAGGFPTNNGGAGSVVEIVAMLYYQHFIVDADVSSK